MVENEFPNRKPTRLKHFDYSRPGAYFLTICTQQRKKLLSTIVGEGLAPPEEGLVPLETKLTPCGYIAEQQLLLLEKRYPNISLDNYVIMPNHIHVILFIRPIAGGASPSPTVSDVMCTFKSVTSRLCKKEYGVSNLFQRSYHDRIIRDQKEYEHIWNYIELNPARWKYDCFYTT